VLSQACPTESCQGDTASANLRPRWAGMPTTASACSFLARSASPHRAQQSGRERDDGPWRRPLNWRKLSNPSAPWAGRHLGRRRFHLSSLEPYTSPADLAQPRCSLLPLPRPNVEKRAKLPGVTPATHGRNCHTARRVAGYSSAVAEAHSLSGAVVAHGRLAPGTHRPSGERTSYWLQDAAGPCKKASRFRQPMRP
jgi:hypothetical protein